MEKEKKRVAGISVITAIFLTGFKLVIGILTGSLGFMSKALHSGLDLAAALIIYFSVRIPHKPTDREHHFGYGKIGNFSALIETLLLVITCVWIVYEAINRLVSGNTHIEVTVWSYFVVISSIAIDVSRSRALYKVVHNYNSKALEADAFHFSCVIIYFFTGHMELHDKIKSSACESKLADFVLFVSSDIWSSTVILSACFVPTLESMRQIQLRL